MTRDTSYPDLVLEGRLANDVQPCALGHVKIAADGQAQLTGVIS